PGRHRRAEGRVCRGGARESEKGIRAEDHVRPVGDRASGREAAPMSHSRRDFIRSVARTAAVFTLDQLIGAGEGLGVRFTNVAKEAGLNAKTIFGGEKRNRYLVETTGCGVAFFDYDNDGWLDIFLVNGTRFESTGPAPTNRLYKNN